MLRTVVAAPGSPAATAALARRSAPELQALTAAAIDHRVVGSLAHSLPRIPGRPAEPLEEEIRQLHQAGVAHHLRVLSDLRAVADTFAAAGVPWLLVKGPALAAVTYARADLRGYHDLDIVVPAASFAASVTALERAGVPVLDRDWELVSRELRGQLHLRLPNGTQTDLHWHLLNDERHRRRFRIPMSSLFERAREAVIGGTPVAILDPTDTLLHLCLHAALSGGHRLVWHADIQQAARNDPPSWDGLVDRARAMAVTAPVGVMLHRARRTVDAPVPDDVLAALLPSRVRRSLVAATDVVWPVGTVSTPGSFGRFATRSHGRGFAPAVADAARWLRRGRDPAAGRDVTANPLLRARGGAEERAAYLAAVTRQAGHATGPTARTGGRSPWVTG